VSAAVLADLARVKVLFQLRSIETVMGFRDSGSKPDRAETAETGSVHESHGGDSQSPKT
jgi:hypothetical protein